MTAPNRNRLSVSIVRWWLRGIIGFDEAKDLLLKAGHTEDSAIAIMVTTDA